MGKYMMKWREKTPVNKAATVTGLISCSLILVLALLQLFNVWENAGYAYMPLLCLNMLTYAVINWKTDRSLAIFHLFVALFLLISIIVVIFVR